MLRLNWSQVVVVPQEDQGEAEEGQKATDEAFTMLERRMRGHVELCYMALLRGTCRLVKVWELSLLVVEIGLGEGGVAGEEVQPRGDSG
jgi:hypothetical protein